jgi:hypothetical protein
MTRRHITDRGSICCFFFQFTTDSVTYQTMKMTEALRMHGQQVTAIAISMPDR